MYDLLAQNGWVVRRETFMQAKLSIRPHKCEPFVKRKNRQTSDCRLRLSVSMLIKLSNLICIKKYFYWETHSGSFPEKNPQNLMFVSFAIKMLMMIIWMCLVPGCNEFAFTRIVPELYTELDIQIMNFECTCHGTFGCSCPQNVLSDEL